MADPNLTKNLSLLVVDDVQVHRYLMSSGLSRINPFIKVDEASSLEVAKEKLGTGTYNAVICDWNMPGGDGGELVKWMRSRPHFKRVPFIMISGNSANEDIIKAFMELQVDAYVVKPFTPQDLYQKLTSVLQKFGW
jgi:CheY-like chemotaxis protein